MIKFDNDSYITYSLGDMIKLYQDLAKARTSENWAAVSLILDRLQKIIDQESICSTEIDFPPSISSVVVSGYGIAHEESSDLSCAFGIGVSSARENGEDNCPHNCPYKKSRVCAPEYGKTLLHRGFTYTGNDEATKKYLGLDD